MDYEKNLFEQNKMNAPENFSKTTMEYILAAEEKKNQKSSVRIEYSISRIGQIFVAAAVLLIILNIFPAEKIVQGKDIDIYPEQHENIFHKAIYGIGNLLDEIKETIDFNIFDNKGENNE
ncbi:MAG: hypothetical protein JXN65_00055 [Clostridia bacterium]|nr:hypothetical protein [Clostridia bacterium]